MKAEAWYSGRHVVRGLSLRGNGSATQGGEEGVGAGMAKVISLSEGGLELILQKQQQGPLWSPGLIKAQ